MSERKKVIISNYDDQRNPWYAGGGAVAIHRLAVILSRDYEVSVVTGMYPGAHRQERIDGVEYRRVGCSWTGPRLGQLVYTLSLIHEVLRLRYDLWIDSFTPPFGVSILPLLAPKKVVGVIHMLPGKDMWRKYRIPCHIIERIGLLWYRRIIVLSESSKSEISRFVSKGTVVSVIPNGIDIPESRPIDLVDEHYILFIGRIEINQKGIDLLLSAFDQVADHSRCSLVIAGSGISSEEKELHRLVRELRHGDRVSLVGRVSGHEKERLFRRAALVVVPSRFETFSIVALEALSYGVPVVAFDIPGLSAVPDRYVKKSEPFSVDDFARSIESAMVSLPAPQSVQETVRPYSWEVVGERYREFLRAII